MFDNMREWIKIHMDEACDSGEEIEYLETMIEEAGVLLEQQQRLTKRVPDAGESAQ